MLAAAAQVDLELALRLLHLDNLDNLDNSSNLDNLSLVVVVKSPNPTKTNKTTSPVTYRLPRTPFLRFFVGDGVQREIEYVWSWMARQNNLRKALLVAVKGCC